VPRKRTLTRVAELSSISDVSPVPGFTASSDRAVPFQVTVIEPPAELYVWVNGAAPCGASEVELLLVDDDEHDDELDELLDDVLVAGGSIGADCPPIVGGGGVTTVEAGAVDNAGSDVVAAGGAVVGIGGAEVCVGCAGTLLVEGGADVDETADVEGASDVVGAVAGAKVSSPLFPLSSTTLAPTMTINVASPAMPARRRRIPRERASTASWARAVSSDASPIAGALFCRAVAKSSSNGSKSVIIALPRAAA